jgi:adenylate cyclase
VLAENAGLLVPKCELIARVWDDVAVTEDSLTQCIGDIRKAIGDSEHRILRTVPRRGYLLDSSRLGVASNATSSAYPPHRPTLAVLPFRSLSGAKGEALAFGVASEIINELARNRDLRVIGRESSFSIGNQPTQARGIGEQLGARYIVEGTTRRSSKTLMVDVHLVDTRSGVIAWGDRFSAEAAGIPRVQRDIAAKIAVSLRVSMHETEKHAVLGRAPRDLGVYELALQGLRKHWFKPDATRASRRDLQEAIRRDPYYAPAWSYLAWVNFLDTWGELTGEWYVTRIDEVIGQFRHAIELDPNLAHAYRGLGQAILVKGDILEAVALHRRALELAPSDPDCLLFLGYSLFESGELAEATRLIEQALALHPFRPSYYSHFHAVILWANELFAEALQETEACLRKAPELGQAEVYRALALVGLGRFDEANAQLAHYRARPSHPVVPPYPPALASRFLADLHTAGWRPSLTPERKAV